MIGDVNGHAADHRRRPRARGRPPDAQDVAGALLLGLRARDQRLRRGGSQRRASRRSTGSTASARSRPSSRPTAPGRRGARSSWPRRRSDARAGLPRARAGSSSRSGPSPTPDRGEAVIRVLAAGHLRHGPADRQGRASRLPGRARGASRATRSRARWWPSARASRPRRSVSASSSRRTSAAARCPACRAGRVNLCANAGGVRHHARRRVRRVHARAGRRASRAATCMRVPPDADPAAVSVVEPLACVLRGQRAVSLGEGDTVLVCGAGPIGLLHVARSRGPRARRRSSSREPHPRRRADAAEFGATVGVDPTAEDLRARVLEVTDGLGADVVITAVPVPRRPGAGARARRGRRPDQLLRRPAQGRVEDRDRLERRPLPGAHADRDDGQRHRRLPARARARDGRAGRSRPHRHRPVRARRGGDAFAAAGGGEELKVVIEP